MKKLSRVCSRSRRPLLSRLFRGTSVHRHIDRNPGASATLSAPARGGENMYSWPATLHFLSVIFAAFSPVLVLSITVIAKQPTYIIVAIFAAFLWLCAITLIAALWWMLAPARDILWVLVLYGVAIQEICRWCTYALYERLMRGLRVQACLRQHLLDCTCPCGAGCSG